MKRVLALVLALGLALPAAACGTDRVPSGTNPSNSPSSSAPSQTSEATEKPKVTLRILNSYTDKDPNTDNSVKVLEEGTGYDLQIDLLPQQGALDKLNLIFASGDVDYDYIKMGTDDQSKSAYITYAKKGLIADITDLLPNYSNLNGIDPLGKEAVTVDGRIYAISSTGLPIPMENNMFRKDWLDALGLSVPATKEELYTVLKTLKEKDPGNMGKDLIPFSAMPGAINSTISQFFGFIYSYEDRNGALVDTRLTPDYKEYLSYMKSLYTEGLLDPDYPILSSSSFMEKIAAGKVAYYSGWVDPARDYQAKMTSEGKDGVYFQAAEPFRAADGVQRTTTQKGLFMIGILPSGSDKAADVLQFIDNYLEPAAFKSMIHGVEGIDYKMVDGKEIPIIPAFDENRGNLSNFFPIQDGDSYFPLWTVRTRKTAEYTVIFESIVKAAYDYQVVNPLAFAPSFESISAEMKIVNDYAIEQAVKFIAGARSLDEFDAYVAEMNIKGADKIINTINEWYAQK